MRLVDIGPRSLVVTLVAAAVLGMPPAFAGQKWLQSYYDAGHSGNNAHETTLSTSNVAQLQLRWNSSAPTNGVTQFVLDNGIIYAQGQGSTAPNLSAISARTGSTLYTITTGNEGTANGSIALVGSLIITGCGFLDQGGDAYGGICGYDKATGSQTWQWSNPCDCLPEAGVIAPLAYDKGVVYFGYGNGGAGAQEYIVALDATTGAQLWTSGTGGPNTLGGATLAVGGGFVYLACNEHGPGVCALDESNGSPAWSAVFGTTTELALTAGKGAVYVSDGLDGYYFAFNGSTGAQLWSYACSTCGNGNFPPSFAGNVLYAPGYRGETFALNARKGTVLWSENIGSENSSISIANGVIYLDEQGNNVPASAAFDASSGALLWSSQGPGSTLSPPPIVANGKLYIANAPCGTVCEYALPRGRVRN